MVFLLTEQIYIWWRLSQALFYLKDISDMSCMLVLIGDFSYISVTAGILSGILFYPLFVISHVMVM